MDFLLNGVAIRVETALVEGVPADIPILAAESNGVHRLDVQGSGKPDSIGIRFSVEGAYRYLRNGFHSWDGSSFVDPGMSDAPGHAVTALLGDHPGAAILGFERHDRFQTRFAFHSQGEGLSIDAETLLDGTGANAGESLLLFADKDVENGLRRWSRVIAAASPLQPRLPERIIGWCSWYNHYAMIDEPTILAELAGAADFRDVHGAPLDVFLIDDGFTTEMGDWLEVSPKFPRGMKPLVDDIVGKGFTPGLWIAPFLVGNRSRLYADHPDWVARDPEGRPKAAMTFYGEFRWHKRSQEYYILDVTHPEAERHIRAVFRTWYRDWGARYFKADFLHFPMGWHPGEVRWHRRGLSRVEIWRKMALLMREEIGDSLLLGCGCPLWASVGLMDAMRIGRDIGPRWSGGEQSAQSLLRDQATRNHAAGILWQGDPDCILLRDQFHELNDAQIDSLARLAAASNGVLMTSDTLSELSPKRAELFSRLAIRVRGGCRFPDLGRDREVLRYTLPNGETFGFNLSGADSVVDGVAVPPFATVRL